MEKFRKEDEHVIDFILKYWLQCVFGAIITGLGYCYRKLSLRLKEQDAVKEGVLAILHDRLFQAARFFIAKGNISIPELRNVEYIYNAYHALGGNGTGTEMWERIKNLPLKEE